MLESLLSLRNRAEFYHRQLADEARWYLRSRGISDTLINRLLIGWNGSAITLPVMDPGREVVAIDLLPITGAATNQTPYNTLELYGWDTLARLPARLVVTDTPLDRLILEAHGFPAACVIGKRGAFPKEWAARFRDVGTVYVAMKDTAVAACVKAAIAGARIVELPPEADGVEDFFVRLRKKSGDFERLLRAADRGAEHAKEQTPPVSARPASKRAERLLADVPLADVVRRYTTLLRVNGSFTARCPLHLDRQRSFYLYPEKNTFKCFGCGAGGDAIDFLMRREELTFFQAVERLAEIKYADE